MSSNFQLFIRTGQKDTKSGQTCPQIVHEDMLGGHKNRLGLAAVVDQEDTRTRLTSPHIVYEVLKTGFNCSPFVYEDSFVMTINNIGRYVRRGHKTWLDFIIRLFRQTSLENTRTGLSFPPIFQEEERRQVRQLDREVGQLVDRAYGLRKTHLPLLSTIFNSKKTKK